MDNYSHEYVWGLRYYIFRAERTIIARVETKVETKQNLILPLYHYFISTTTSHHPTTTLLVTDCTVTYDIHHPTYNTCHPTCSGTGGKGHLILSGILFYSNCMFILFNFLTISLFWTLQIAYTTHSIQFGS